MSNRKKMQEAGSIPFGALEALFKATLGKVNICLSVKQVRILSMELGRQCRVYLLLLVKSIVLLAK
jgi:hypothetical protein